MAENKEEVVEQTAEETKVEETVVEEQKAEEPKKDTGFQEDGTYKMNLDQPTEEEKPVDAKINVEPVEEEKQEETKEELVLEEVTNEEEQPETDPFSRPVEHHRVVRCYPLDRPLVHTIGQELEYGIIFRSTSGGSSGLGCSFSSSRISATPTMGADESDWNGGGRVDDVMAVR